MLVLTVRKGESFLITGPDGREMTITVCTRRNHLAAAFDGDRDVKVERIATPDGSGRRVYIREAKHAREAPR